MDIRAVDVVDRAWELKAGFSGHACLLCKYRRPGKSFAKVGIEGMINLLWVGILLNSGPDPVGLGT